MATAKDVLAIAESEIGYLETGNNQTKFWAKWKPSFQGQPWCAIFIHDVFDRAGLTLPFLYTYVPTLTTHARNTGRQAFQPQPGDIAMYWKGAHTGIVESVGTNGNFTAIEGNTSPTSAGSQNNGGGVYRKTRNVSDCPDGFYRPAYTAQEDDLTPAQEAMLARTHDRTTEAWNEAKAANAKVQELGKINEHMMETLVAIKAKLDA